MPRRARLSSPDLPWPITQVTDTQGGTLTRLYDGLDRLTRETTAQGQLDYSYDAASRRASATVAGQAALTYAYDNANRLTGLTRGSDTVGLSDDAADRRATLTLPNAIVASYSYDNANQLSAISYDKGATTIGDLSYGYDAAGQRTALGGSLGAMTLPAALASASYDAANRLTNWAGTALSYDLNGNLLSDGSKTFNWDARNRLAALSGAASASFAYDPFGRRTGRTVGAVATGFVYDGINPVQELTGTTPKANLLTGPGVDAVFARTDSTGTKSFLTDALGSSLALSDAAGTLQTQYSYEPYGKTTASGAASDNAVQYTGRENDQTGLYFYRARYYDPLRQRFVSEDPIGLEGGINPYVYVNNAPTMYVDPSGENPVIIAGAILGGLAGGISAYQQGGSLGQVAFATGSGALAGGVIAATATSLVVATAARFAGGTIANLLGQGLFKPDDCQFNYAGALGAGVNSAFVGGFRSLSTAAAGISSTSARIGAGIPFVGAQVSGNAMIARDTKPECGCH